MGRKVHPNGFRLKIIRDWKARWYAEGSRYRELLGEDFAIRDLILSEASAAGIANVEIERFPNQVQVIVYTSKPGVMIGRKGAAVKELRGKLRKLTGKSVKLEIEEVKSPEIEAALVADGIKPARASCFTQPGDETCCTTSDAFWRSRDQNRSVWSFEWC